LRSGDAFCVAQAARQIDAQRRMRLVSITANGRGGDLSSYEPTLFDFNLVKPVPMEELAQILRLAPLE